MSPPAGLSEDGIIKKIQNIAAQHTEDARNDSEATCESVLFEKNWL